MQHETTHNDKQVDLPELPEWNGEFMTESEFAEAAQAYALEAVRLNRPAGGEAVEFDFEAVAWAYAKLRDFGCYASERGAMMGDRLNLMLLAPVATTQAAQVQQEAADHRYMARDIHHAIMDDGLAPLSPADNNALRETILRALNAAHPAADALGAVRELQHWAQIKLWFFRELTSEQRLALLSLCGLPVDEIGESHAMQRKGLEAALAQAPAVQHPDDVAVDRFAVAMKAKLAGARAKGRCGWEDKDDCTQSMLSRLLREHVEKGDPRDVANFCMFLHQRGETIAQAPAVRVDDVLLRVSDEDLRWCKDIVGALQEAGGPTNNMRAVGLSRLIAALEAALGQGVES